MKEILLSLACGGVLSVLCDAFLPRGGLKKYARLFIGITIATILITPVCEFINKTQGDIPAFEYEEGYISMVESQYQNMIEISAKTALGERNITADVEISWDGEEISQITITTKEKLDAKRATEIGKQTAEILNVPLCKIILKGE